MGGKREVNATSEKYSGWRELKSSNIMVIQVIEVVGWEKGHGHPQVSPGGRAPGKYTNEAKGVKLKCGHGGDDGANAHHSPLKNLKKKHQGTG